MADKPKTWGDGSPIKDEQVDHYDAVPKDPCEGVSEETAKAYRAGTAKTAAMAEAIRNKRDEKA